LDALRHSQTRAREAEKTSYNSFLNEISLIHLEIGYTDIYWEESSIKILLRKKNYSMIEKLIPQEKGKKGQF